MSRLGLALLFAAAGFATAVSAGPLQEPVSPPSDTELNLGERAARLTVDVSVDGNQPRPFIIDTGAERSVVSRQLAGALGLAPGPEVTLATMTGLHRTGTARVSGLSIGALQGTGPFNAPVLEAVHLGAHGLIGLDQLRDRVVSIDFERLKMGVREARGRMRSNSYDEIVVNGRDQLGQLIVTSANYAGRRITVVIDTGSAVTMGNSAFRRLVERSSGRPEPIVLTSVSGQQLSVPYTVTSRVQLGPATLIDLPVAFADVPPFERFGLANRPALLLGMDALRIFRQVDIDFANRQVRLRLPRTYRTMSS